MISTPRARPTRTRRTFTAAIVIATVAIPLHAIDPPAPDLPTPSEQAAVELLLEWSAAGAPAVRAALADASCFSGLPASTIDAEIEARLGSPDTDRTWELQGLPWTSEQRAVLRARHTSGLDEYVLFTFAGGEDAAQLACVSTWGEPLGPTWAEVGAVSPPAPPGPSAPALSSSWAAPPRASGVLSVLLLVVLAAAVASTRGWRATYPLAALALGVSFVSCRHAPEALDSGANTTWRPSRLSGALAVRDALDAGLSLDLVATRVAELEPGPARDLGERWLAQLEVLLGRFDAAEGRLTTIPDTTALDATLRGRLALMRGDAVAAEAAWDRASERFPAVDGLRAELAESLFLLGAEVSGQANLRSLVDAGTRLSTVWYTLASLVALDGNIEGGARVFARAWALEPLERADVVRNPIRTHLAAEAELVEALALGPAVEPPRPGQRQRDPSRRPISPVEGLNATTTGELLRFHRTGFELLVPGGAALAPSESQVVDAAARRREIEARALSRVEGARRELGPVALLASPTQRDQVLTASMGLARSRNWPALVALTEGIDSDRSVLLPPELGQLRAAALRHEGKLAAARSLLVRVAGEAVKARRRDPALYLQLADLLLDLGAFDDADRAAAIADSQLSFLVIPSMRPRIAMERRLAEDFATIETDHFLIRYPPMGDPEIARTMGQVLETEISILAPWIPWKPAATERIEVHLLQFHDFMEHYSIGGTAIASFDGALRLPLAEVREIPPLVHEILVHELAHALLDGATRGRAPAWLQEGLAQHLEPAQHASNLLPDYTRSNRRIAVPLIEAVFGGRPRPDLVAVAYDESLWVARYIEHRWGREGFHRLIQSFAREPSPELGLEQALGVTFAALDEQTWNWTLEEVPKGWKPRSDRKVRSQVVRQPTIEAAAKALRLEGGEGLDRGPDAPATPREAAALRQALTDFERSLVPLARALVAWRQARASSNGAAMKEACSALVATPLDPPTAGRGHHQQLLRQRMLQALKAAERLQSSCRSSAWSHVDVGVTNVERAIGEAQGYVDKVAPDA
jgi:hypothetical protein